MNKLLPSLLLVSCFFFGHALSAQTLSTNAFFRFNEFDEIKISPDGKHLAMTIPRENQAMLIIVNVDSNEIVARFTTPNRQKVGQFFWANNERILFAPVILTGGLDTPLITGEVYALNIDDTQKFRLVGPSMADRQVYYISNMLLDDPEHVRVTSKELRTVTRGSFARARATSHLLDIYARPDSITERTGNNLRQSERSPLEYGEVYTDHAGVVRLATAINDDNRLDVRYRRDNSAEWVDLSAAFGQRETLVSEQFLDFSADNNSFFFLEYTASGTLGLVQYLPDSASKVTTYAHPDFDIAPENILVSADRTAVLGVKFFGDVIERHYFSEHPDVALHRSLDAAFPEDLVRITSTTRDGSCAVIFVSGPRRIGDYFLLDTATMSVTQIGSQNSELPLSQMAEVRPFIIRNREGMELHGIVTVPREERENMPMIVIPHGGPIGVRDTIEFNREAQFFAHHGYIVLQVNFRGSGGYGFEFVRQGFENWGTGMINDISLAATWAVQNNIADRDKICIFGGSYGAFAAVASVIREPEKYRCAVGYSGVYDLVGLADSDIPFLPGGEAYLRTTLGSDAQALQDQSPVNHVAAIRVPLFLAHGGEDQRAPVSQVEQLRTALDAASLEYDWLLLPNEGHGFYNEENRVDFYNRSLEFVNRHLR